VANIKLKILRQTKGLSQEDMAREINLPTTTYVKKELGKSRFYIDEAFAISRVLGIGINEIFFNDFVSK
jgi:DNA-binding XRE family transcriptional regulator